MTDGTMGIDEARANVRATMEGSETSIDDPTTEQALRLLVEHRRDAASMDGDVEYMAMALSRLSGRSDAPEHETQVDQASWMAAHVEWHRGAVIEGDLARLAGDDADLERLADDMQGLISVTPGMASDFTSRMQSLLERFDEIEAREHRDMAEAQQDEMNARGWQEHVAGEPGASEWSDAEHARRRDAFMGLEPAQRVFLDDDRDPRPGTGEWTVYRSAEELKAAMEGGLRVSEMSVDNDLGSPMEGRDLMKWMVELEKADPGRFEHLERVTAHSANSAGGDAIVNAMEWGRSNGMFQDVVVDRIRATEADYPLNPEIAERRALEERERDAAAGHGVAFQASGLPHVTAVMPKGREEVSPPPMPMDRDLGRGMER